MSKLETISTKTTKFYILHFAFCIALVACTTKSEVDKKAQLEKLKSQQTDLKKQIQKLEAELATNDTGATAMAAKKVKIVGVTIMEADTFKHYIEIQGKVEGDKDVVLSAQMPGTVTAVNVAPGSVVKKGQLLAAVEDNGVGENLAEVRTQLELARTVFTRQKNLWDQGIGSEVQYLQAKTNKDALERRMAAVQSQYNLSQFKSPIDGTVDQVDIKVGQVVAPGMPAIRVVNMSSMKVKGEVAESYISNVKKGADVIVYFPDQKREIASKVTYSGQAINRLNRTFNVEVKLKPTDGEVHPNQVAVLKIIDYTAPETFVVPVAAVQKSSTGEFVYVVKNNNGKDIALRRTILTGLSYNGFAEVTSGLQQGDKVITTGQQNIVEGETVKFQ